MLTDGGTDGKRMPISHPAISRCDKKVGKSRKHKKYRKVGPT